MVDSIGDYDYLFKLLIIGDSGVGKSSLLIRYTEDQFNGQYICTIGVDFKVKTIMVNGKRVKLQIWDTAGQERFRTITSTYYRGAHGVIIVYDVCDVQSFLNVERWVSEAKNYAAPSVARMLIGNKNDLPDQKQVSEEDGKRLAIDNDCLFLEASARDNRNVSEMFHALCSEILRLKYLEQQQRPDTIRVSQNSRIKRKKAKCC